MLQPFESPSDVDGKHIAVIGSGYVGLTLSACLARRGHRVICTDVSIDRVARLVEGDIPIVEDGLPELIREVVEAGRLSFGIDNTVAVADAEFVYLCLPTPEGADGQADLSFVTTVAREIRSHLRPGTVVINKSTVPVGTAEMVEVVLGRDDVHVVSNPEFLAEGSALHDSLYPDRVVVGARTRDVGQRVARLYEGQTTEGQINFILTDVLSAELIKYASNAYLATRLTFVNAMAEMCEAVGADIRAVTAGMGADRRIGPAFLRPGPGWGGSCFPKDTQALVHTADLFGCDMSLVRSAIALNAAHTSRVAQKVIVALDGHLQNRRVAIWGLTFKAGTDDLRCSPALEIAARLRDAGAVIQAYDPTVERPIQGIELRPSMKAACEGADVLLVATEWPAFAEVDLSLVAACMRNPALVDARNLLDPAVAVAAGFRYWGIGLGHLRSDSESVAA